MPTTVELSELRDILLKYALGAKADRQRRALEHIFGRIIIEGDSCEIIKPEEIMNLRLPPGEKMPDNPKDAAHGLIRDIGLRLDAFYGEGRSSGKLPHPESQKVKYRVDFIGSGNYMLTFSPYRRKQPEPDLVPYFWSPHLRPGAGARILYPEPIFLVDDRQTFFRNAAMGTEPDAAALAYLNIPGEAPRTGYSYVPSGIVRALLLLIKTLRPHERQPTDFESVKPYLSTPPGDEDLILLATPSTTNLVDTVQDGQRMVVDAKEGAHSDGKLYADNDHVKWGILTRTWQSHRIITMLAAKHGRGVEAMAKFLTRHGELGLLAQRMGRTNLFPKTFQVLFRIPVTNTPEGPVVKDALIEEIFIPDNEQPESPAAQVAE